MSLILKLLLFNHCKFMSDYLCFSNNLKDKRLDVGLHGKL